MKMILITAFEPFGGRALNASEIALQALPDSLEGVRLYKKLLPVETGRASEAIIQAIDDVQPDAVVCLGEAMRDALCVEQIGYNERRYTIPDNAGNTFDGDPIELDGPPDYRATLPTEAMVAAMQAAGVPASLSEDAGRYLCNEVLFSALHHLAKSEHTIPAGFIHVPRLPEAVQEEEPSLPTEETTRGILAALEVLTALI
jgi:pyroglutamyl-peptidase